MKRVFFAVVLGACSPIFACTPAQLEEGIMQTLDGVSKIDPPIRKSYKRELGVSGCLEPGKTDAEITACVRDSMECPASFASGECMAKTIKEWAPVKATMIAIHNAWCAIDKDADGCAPKESEMKP